MKRIALITFGNTSWLTLEPAKEVALFQLVMPEASTVAEENTDELCNNSFQNDEKMKALES